MSTRFCAVDGCSEVLGPRTKRKYCTTHQYFMDHYGVPYRPKGAYPSKKNHGNFEHGKPPEYKVWLSMKSRCYYEKNPSYLRYGGRGIKVCDRWLGDNGFENFLSDMGSRPAGNYPSGRAKYPIDRIDNEPDYSPDNCRWATVKEQSNNRSSNHIIEGETMAGWGEELGGCRHLVRRRLKWGWSIDDAIHVPNKKLRER